MSRRSWRHVALAAVCLIHAAEARATVFLDATTVGDGPYYLDIQGETYVLSEDLATQGSGLVFAAQNVTLDLNGHTLTFGNSSAAGRIGVAVPPAYPHAYWVATTDITIYSACSGATVKNGSIVQGAGRAAGCAAIRSLEEHDITVENVSITIYGDDTSAIYYTDCRDLRVTDCDITDSTNVITNRHAGRAAIDFENAHDGLIEIARNTIHSAPQWGIRVSRRAPSTVTGQVFDNTIDLANIVTNGYGLGLHGNNLEAYGNVIYATNGRGIHIEGCDSVSVHDNTVEVINEPFWDEYTRMQAHGIKLEQCSNTEVYFNHVISYGRCETTDAACNGSALNITVYAGSNNYVHNNTFIARHLGGSLFVPSDYTKYSAAIEIVYIAPNSGLRVENNTFVTQDRFLSTEFSWKNNPDVDPIDVTDTIIKGNTWTRETTPVPTQKFDIFWASHVAGLRLIDNLGEADFRNFGRGWPWSDNEWGQSWSGVVRATDSSGVAVPGITMEIRNNQNTLVFTGTSDSNGECAVMLDEFTGSSNSGVTELGPYEFKALFSDGDAVLQAPIEEPGFVVVLESGPPTSPVAEFTGFPTSGNSPLTVSFRDQSTHVPTAWTWTFGDGATSTDRNPDHTYVGAGTYTVTLVSRNASGADSVTKVDYITVTVGPADTTPPAAVTDLTGSTITDSAVSLAWSAPGDDGTTGTAYAYDMRYSTAFITASNFPSAIPAAGAPVPAVSGSTQSMTVTGLSPQTTYYFAVRTVDDAGNWSPVGSPLQVQTLDPPQTPQLVAPAGLAATPIDYGFELSWGANSEADLLGYRVYRRVTTGTWTQRTSNPIEALAWPDSVSIQAGKIEYRVTAVNTRGAESAPSATVQVELSGPGDGNGFLQLSGPFPNPFAAATRLRLSVSPGGLEWMHISILDVSGRKVRTVYHGRGTEGDHEYEWKAEDDLGRSLPPGVYFLVAQGPNLFECKKIVRCR